MEKLTLEALALLLDRLLSTLAGHQHGGEIAKLQSDLRKSDGFPLQEDEKDIEVTDQ